ncbi:hypothetical protein DCC79_14635 [bacterium]|nr:MAG: hypothetical protein DCC79_14635 [bacterium]
MSQPSSPPSPASDIASFVLRFTQDVWRASSGDPHVRWRGHIRHVQSDDETRFTDFADAVAFIQRQLAQLTLASVADASAADQAMAVTDSFRLWERFATGYADLMRRSVEQTIEQTEAYQRQVGESFERSLQAWNPLLAAGRRAAPPEPPRPPDAAVLAALADMRAELQAIRERVDRLAEALGAGGHPPL